MEKLQDLSKLNFWQQKQLTTAINLELESAKSSQLVPVLQDLEKKEVEKKRLPETREQAVW